MSSHSFRINSRSSRLVYMVGYLFSSMLSALEEIVANLSHISSQT